MSRGPGAGPKAPHGGGDWKLKPIAPSLGAFLAAVGIWAEVVHGQFQGNILDEDYELRTDVSQALEAALEPVLETRYRRHWITFE